LEVNAAMSQISAHPLVWAQSQVQHPWALFRETMVHTMSSIYPPSDISVRMGIKMAVPTLLLYSHTLFK